MNDTPNASDNATPSLPALLGHMQIVLVVIATVILSVVVLAHGLIFLGSLSNLGLVALVNQAGPAIGVLLMTLASYINFYGTWRIARGKDKYDVREDLKSHAADVPYALSRLGCSSLISPLLLAIALVTAGLTYAPAPFDFLGAATATMPPTPTPTPTVTPTPLPTLRLALIPAQSVWDCNTSGREITPVSLILDNSASNVDAGWSASARESVGLSAQAPWAAVRPNQGTVAAKSQQTITLTPSIGDCAYASPAGTPYHLDLALNGGAAGGSTATFTYTISGLRRLSFKLNPTQYPAVGQNPIYCSTSVVLSPVTVTLDNSGSNVDVGWQAAIIDKDASGSVWATTSPAQGTVAAGKTAPMTVTPSSDVCKQFPPNGASYHVNITLTSGGTGSYTFTYNVNASPPPA